MGTLGAVLLWFKFTGDRRHSSGDHRLQRFLYRARRLNDIRFSMAYEGKIEFVHVARLKFEQQWFLGFLRRVHAQRVDSSSVLSVEASSTDLFRLPGVVLT